MNNGHLPLLLGFLLSLTACCICLEVDENAAIGKMANQSSIFGNYGPYRAIDGNRNANLGYGGSCTHTNEEMKPWWRVDLFNVHNISSVVVTNRGDCCAERLNGAEIRIGNSLVDNGNSNPLCAQIPSIPAGGTVTYSCPGMLGRYVTISLSRTGIITLCEVEVYGRVVHEDVCGNPISLLGLFRNIDYSYTGFPGFPRCDSAWAGRWVRFQGIVGDVIPESCVGACCSGSLSSAYLGFTHPQLGEDIKQGTTLIRSSVNCLASAVVGMRVLACPGGYYVYRLPPVLCPVTFAVRHSNCTSTSCGPNAECTSSGGCVCVPGYGVPVNALPTPESLCFDIDECENDPVICGPNADCINTPGSYTCTCHEGYSVQIMPGSIASTSNPCEDVDECVQNPCGINTDCYNTVGSFYCVCKEGYISSTGLVWVSGTSVCQSTQEFLASLTPPEGQSREMFFLNQINQDLEGNPDLVLPEETVTAVLSTTLSVTGIIEPKDGDSETANVVLKVSEGLVSSLVEPESQRNNTVSQRTVKTAAVEMNLVSLSGNATETPAVLAKGNMMTINLAAVAKNNNGSASAVLMSIDGMEKFMSPSFFKSENITEMYSDIITATLPKTRHKELPEPVNFTMHHKKETFQAGLVTCAYWKENGNETHWSVEGCTASFSNENYTVCSCTHLSTFALLLQTGEPEEDNSLLEMVDLFCMCAGLAFLALAILTFLLCTWNPKVNNTARLHLCICLFLGHLLFLVGVSRTENAVVCAVIAGLLHFIFLAGFVWMLLETVQLFLLVRSLTKVQVIQKEGLKTLYLLLIGYGAPMVVVGVSAAVFSGGYGSKDSCWLKQEKNFRWSFIGPVAAILALNLVSFGVILWSLQPTLANMKSNVSQSKDTRLIIFKIVAQFFVLGCAWILGFFQSSTLLKYLFIILNSQQGTFIFIVHCLLNKEVRKEYRRWFSCLFRKEGPSGDNATKDTVNDASQPTKDMDKADHHHR
ncbi:adhesion G protein-coupled receptor E2-like isoform X1 [Anguilla rostrata]|uniref:adhesion G protein-coupled receptor E2-like isoform X1 n=2 Tax=Anguilla rostrata TaxID=7938 RepID=UPI0030CCC428